MLCKGYILIISIICVLECKGDLLKMSEVINKNDNV